MGVYQLIICSWNHLILKLHIYSFIRHVCPYHYISHPLTPRTPPPPPTPLTPPSPPLHPHPPFTLTPPSPPSPRRHEYGRQPPPQQPQPLHLLQHPRPLPRAVTVQYHGLHHRDHHLCAATVLPRWVNII